MFRRFLPVGFIAHWILIDKYLRSLSDDGLSTPWYPQAATSLVLLYFADRSGRRDFKWALALIAVAKLTSSILVWPGAVVERIFPSVLFAAAMGAMALCFRGLRSLGEISLRKVASGLGWLFLIGLVNSAIRQIYYAGSAEISEDLVQSIVENWIGDVASIICLAPALAAAIEQGRARVWGLMTGQMKAHGALTLGIAALILASICGVGELQNFAYIAIIPCIAMTTLEGIPAALIAAVLTNIGFGIVAVTHEGRMSVIELQVYFVSLDLMMIFLGLMVTERHRRFAAIVEASRLAIQAQLAKIQVLVELQQQALRPFADLLQNLGSSKDVRAIHDSAEEMLRRLESFYQKIRDRVPGKGPLENVPIAKIPGQIENFVLHLFPADMSAPDVRLARRVAPSVLCVRENLNALLSRLVILLSQIGRDPQRAVNPSSIVIRISSPKGTLRIDCETECPSILVEEPDLAVVPPGGFALSIYVLKSLALAMGGSFDVRPDYYDLKNKLNLQISLPLIPETENA